LKDFLNKAPVIKKVLKFLFKGILRKQEKKRVAAYNRWLMSQQLDSEGSKKQKREAGTLAYQPLVSIIAPTYNTPEVFFREMVESVLWQTYAKWELILVDDASSQARVRELIKEYAEKDQRIKPVFLNRNRHIAGATNEAIKVASGEFVSLFDHDDLLRPDALFEVARALNDNRNLDFIYTDEDKLEQGVFKDPFFKPDWNPDFLRSVNYITHFTTIRKKILDKVGYENGDYNGAQDWELYLRITRTIPPEKIHHIPKVLYSWRIHDASTSRSFEAKPYVVEAQRNAIKDDLRARGLVNANVQQDPVYSGQWQLTFSPVSKPIVSIVVRDEGFGEVVRAVEKRTAYDGYEVVSYQEGDDLQDILTTTKGEYLVFLDRANVKNIDDQNWLSVMVGDAEREEIGFVVARYQNNRGVNENIIGLLPALIATFAERLSPKTVTKHLYTFARYNIAKVGQGTVIVKTSKLQEALGVKRGITLVQVSDDMKRYGYRNLYNPYVKC
jgi:glycosyltransferase involved in cell wall biosynthesis